MSDIPVGWTASRRKELMAKWKRINRRLGNEPYINLNGLHGVFFSQPYRDRWEKGQRSPLKKNIQSLQHRIIRKNLWCNKEGKV